MRCLGNGYLYGYNPVFPSGLLVAMIWGGVKHDKIVEVILYVTFVVCLLGIGFYFWKLKHSKTQKVDGDMELTLAHLKKMPNPLVPLLALMSTNQVQGTGLLWPPQHTWQHTNQRLRSFFPIYQ